MAESAAEAETCLNDCDIQIEVKEPEVTFPQTTPATMTRIPSIEVTAVADEKLSREQRRNYEELAMPVSASSSTASTYGDDPPSYSIFVIGGLQGENAAGVPRPLENTGHLHLMEKTTLALPAADAASCRGCQSKKNGFGNAEEFNRRGDQMIVTCTTSVECSDKVDRDSDEYREMEAWRQFTSTTTMHGIKYVFEDRPFTMRRMLWLICVVTCVVLFSYQAINRVCIYFEHASNVDVQITYVDELDFPAVTICNYNNYRITEVVQRGLYSAIESVFGNIDLSIRKKVKKIALMSSTDGTIRSTIDGYNESYVDFVEKTAHQLTDFVDGCTWQGENCAKAENWTTTFTDFGVCYTFNGDNEQQRTVTRSGSGFALSLTLNIEQYEYMSGPHQEAGVKVLLHDQSEIPQVSNFGFAVAPGTHNLVSVERQSIANLEPPYGECDSTARPRSLCLARCEAEQIEQQCRCRDVYMPKANNASNQTDTQDVVCNMDQSFFCVREKLAVLVRDDKAADCRCPVRCHRVLYEPVLSNAQLSRIAFDRLFLHQPNRKDELGVKYGRARETAQRVDVTLLASDNNLIADVITTVEAYVQAVNYSVMVMTNPKFSWTRYGILSHDLIDNCDPPIADLALVNSSHSRKAERSMVVFPSMTTFTNIPGSLEYFLDVKTVMSNLRVDLEKCASLETDESTACQPNLTSQVGSSICNELDSYHITTPTALANRKFSLNIARSRAISSSDELRSMTKLYYDNLNFIFGNTSVNYQSMPEHIQCLAVIDEVKAMWLPRLANFITNLSSVYIDTCSWKTKLSLVDQIYQFYNLTVGSDAPTAPGRYAACGWYQRKNWLDVVSDKHYGLFTANSDAAVKMYLEISTMRHAVIKDSNSMLDEVIRRRHFLIDPLRRFTESGLSFNFTKIDLGNYFRSAPANMTPESLAVSSERFAGDWQQWVNKLSDLAAGVYAVYDHAFHLSIPPLDDSTVAELSVVAYARLVAGTDGSNGHLASPIDGLATDQRNAALLGLVSTLHNEYVTAMQDIQARVVQTYQDMLKAMNALLMDLESYRDRGQLDDQFLSDNFIKLDVFYKELSYEEVEQQIAFDLLNLFSEIGGLLGLLLGSSVLTVCELVDFIAMLCAVKLRARRRKNGDDGQQRGEQHIGDGAVGRRTCC